MVREFREEGVDDDDDDNYDLDDQDETLKHDLQGLRLKDNEPKADNVSTQQISGLLHECFIECLIEMCNLNKTTIRVFSKAEIKDHDGEVYVNNLLSSCLKSFETVEELALNMYDPFDDTDSLQNDFERMRQQVHGYIEILKETPICADDSNSSLVEIEQKIESCCSQCMKAIQSLS